MSSNNSNGINAMLAHSWRKNDDNNFVRSIIEGYMFLGFGVVTKIEAERMTVDCGERKYTNVELMIIGVDGWGLKTVPAVNDRVLLLTTQVPVENLKTFTASGSMPPYDQSGIKAIPITDSTSAQLITVTKDGIELTGNVKLTVNDNGIRVEDKNNNVVETTDAGITISDANENVVELTSTGIKATDANENVLDMSGSGVVLTDNKNKDGSKINTVSMTSSGVEIDDKNGNAIKMTSSGVEIDDKNGNKIVMGSSNVTINGKLEVGQ